MRPADTDHTANDDEFEKCVPGMAE